MKIKGTIKQINEVVKGTTKDGNEWQKVTFVVANNEGYQGKEQIFAFDIFGEEKVSKFKQYNKVGKAVEVSFNIRTNEHRGKFYTFLDAWSVYSEKKDEKQDLPF